MVRTRKILYVKFVTCYSKYIFDIICCTFSKGNTHPEITCAAWPSSEVYGCTLDGKDWKSLDKNLDSSQKSTCQKLCITQRENGCCYLSNSMGCWWKSGAKVSSVSGDNGIAVKCSTSGTAP